MISVPTIAITHAIADANQLIQDLMKISLDGAGRQGVAVGILEDRVDDARREDSRQHRADRASGSMHSKGVERIVIAEKHLE